MSAARDHISKAEDLLQGFIDRDGTLYPGMRATAIAHFVAAIAHTLADMADMDADTRPHIRKRGPFVGTACQCVCHSMTTAIRIEKP